MTKITHCFLTFIRHFFSINLSKVFLPETVISKTLNLKLSLKWVFLLSYYDITESINHLKEKTYRIPENIFLIFSNSTIYYFFPLSLIFSCSLASFVVSKQCKQSHVIPGYTNGRKKNWLNYRTISFTSSFL